MKKIAFIGITLLALAATAQTLASDYGGKDIINHSNGVLVYKKEKLEFAKLDAGVYQKLVKFYTVAAAYPTTFTPEAITWDGGLGCVKHTLTNTGPNTGVTAGNAITCDIDVPFQALDAGTYQIYRELDGGYGVSQCSSAGTVPTTTWPAFCTVQLGTYPF